MLSFVLNHMIEYDPKLRVRKPIFKVPTYVSEIVCYEPGQVTATHHHPNQDEIWLVMEGKGIVTIGEETQDVVASSLIFIPAGVRHGIRAADDSRMVLLFIKSPGIPGSAPPGSGGGQAAHEPSELQAPAAGATMQLEVADVQAEARDVISVELQAPGGAQLPPFEPGAHLPIDLPNGLRRHYSLSGDWRERDRYVIGIARAPQSKGGSLYAHQSLRRGMSLQVAAPRNNFPLAPDAAQYLFIAGGIGITPLLAMIRWCSAQGKPWRLAYAVRSAQRAAFLETLQAMPGGQVHVHADNLMAGFFDPVPWLQGAPEGEHVYCCGPAPMMAAVKAAASHRDPKTVHFEYFAAPQDSAPAAGKEHAFMVELRRSSRTLQVPANKSILEVLEENGVEGVVSSCREGTCRTCETGICEGQVEHRDFCLTPEEQQANKSMMVCVSRARSERLVLDL
ncbi:cupin domain-containing protein [Castellaniella caeni]|uniref:cupin domain-containing protein n=1 Tax=Castellaniella caeni TaxID=266123 RepID=UPI000A033864|nr:cupin domain-containing protein [Castellaniella caeni]